MDIALGVFAGILAADVVTLTVVRPIIAKLQQRKLAKQMQGLEGLLAELKGGADDEPA